MSLWENVTQKGFFNLWKFVVSYGSYGEGRPAQHRYHSTHKEPNQPNIFASQEGWLAPASMVITIHSQEHTNLMNFL